ncbi:MAG: CRISPR-associated helicase Cas3' [Lachnospiraceae bacterium]|jgi:CRISPR-associated endonuclease/helicase Cas3|nr:CRISPR-associated helicase Cas3' [Lachnospiraceae bacterium]
MQTEVLQTLWAKKSKNGNNRWLPLTVHLADTVEMAGRLWRKWLPTGTKTAIIQNLSWSEAESKNQCDEEDAYKLLRFLAATHDIGKATPAFQGKQQTFYPTDLDRQIIENILSAGFPIKDTASNTYRKPVLHATISQAILVDKRVKRNIAVIAGAHHGTPANRSDEKLISSKQKGVGQWKEAQTALFDFALQLADVTNVAELPTPNLPGQVILCGLLIMADWLASNEDFFPLVSIQDAEFITWNYSARGKKAWDRVDLPICLDMGNSWMGEDLYVKRFHFPTPNPMQEGVLRAAASMDSPGMLVIEAPMGMGKTEAALVAAEIFTNKFGTGGLFFALPTQATSDGIFPRLIEWIKNLEMDGLPTVNLVHGKSEWNEDFSLLKEASNAANLDDEEEAIVHPWFTGRKQAMLADYVVGTIDQLLMMALQQKHLMLRHLALANKVVIIDECHAYDAYMSHYLDRALRWLGVYKIPVIVLSATLPIQKRKELIGNYLNQDEDTILRAEDTNRTIEDALPTTELTQWSDYMAYPLITYTNGNEIKQLEIPWKEEQRTISMKSCEEDSVATILQNLLADGGVAGIICNTVGQSQQLAHSLEAIFGDAVTLIHSRFLTPDRMAREEILRRELGRRGDRPYLRIVVGTQVLEQSLDIDFDVLFTELAPMDLLLQRLGRLFRHSGRKRPSKLLTPTCYIIQSSDQTGSLYVYGEYLLHQTRTKLPDQINLPRDIPKLVQKVYGGLNLSDEIQIAKNNWDQKRQEQDRRAETFCLHRPWLDPSETMEGLLVSSIQDDAEDKKAKAAVRDTQDSLEVILIQEKQGRYELMDGTVLPSGEVSDDLAKVIAKHTLRLPSKCSHYAQISALEESSKVCVPLWQKNHWLTGELFLIVNETGSAVLEPYQLQYSKKYGLMVHVFEDTS